MNTVFEHISEVKYWLSRLFDSGFASTRAIDAELAELAVTADELQLKSGGELLRQLSEKLVAVRADITAITGAATVYSNLIMYYELTSKMLVLEVAFAADTV